MDCLEDYVELLYEGKDKVSSQETRTSSMFTDEVLPRTTRWDLLFFYLCRRDHHCCSYLR